MEEEIKRQMPCSKEAEQAVVGSMIMDRDAITKATDILKKDDFYFQQYGLLFETIVEMNDLNITVDNITLRDKLSEKQVSPELYSVEFLAQTINAVPVSINVVNYAQIVKKNSMLRNIIKVNQEIENECFSGKEELEVILNETESKIFSLLENQGGSDYDPINAVVMRAIEKIEKAAKTTDAVTGIPTGFEDLDLRTAGLQPSDLILVAARPSMGKTAFVLNVAQYITLRKGLCAAIFSLEMSKEQLVNRMFALESRIDAQKLRTGDLNESDWKNLMEGAGSIATSRLIIDDTPGISIQQLRSKCRKYKLEHGLDIIIIDYLQLMSGSGKSESRQQEISEISRSLKALARELNVPVVALSQLSRAVEQRPDHRPMLSDLRESGAIEQDADVVMFIYRDDYYNKDTEKQNISEIIIAKQRNGPIGTVELAWLPQYTKFANLIRKRDEDNF